MAENKRPDQQRVDAEKLRAQQAEDLRSQTAGQLRDDHPSEKTEQDGSGPDRYCGGT
ncbi:hypothetical protein [Kroppenstedtia eburnea]|uniref:hypothetical protein n=1 Tax=Kroppenstedtia eburnea TaxID=714067 RepID=UPI001356578D|nr:hypothetical protein [Kroppenstedtia eburnea]QKI81535.1 hypothetical protein GXN75_05730 [Kroppenstedtia eburnea]